MADPAYLQLSVRAFAPPKSWRAKSGEDPTGRRSPAWRDDYRWVLVYDCETTTDHRQRLLFGVYQLCRIDWQDADARVVCMEEGFFLADDIERVDPGSKRRASAYWHRHQLEARSDLSDPDASPVLRLLSLDEFLKRRYEISYVNQAVLAGFHLAFDEASTARLDSPSRTPGFENGFALSHHTFTDRHGEPRPSLWRPRLDVRSLDSKRSFVAFKKPKYSDFAHTKGKFVDLRMLVFAQTSKSHSLDSACRAYGVAGKTTPHLGRVDAKAITYCRDDVDATRRLLQAALTEHSGRGIDLAPHAAYSPASYGKAAIAQIGCPPALVRQPAYPRDLLGAATAAFYGARTECKIRAWEVPVVICDFLSEYPTVCSLIGAWRYFTARQIRHDELNPKDTEHWLRSLTLKDLCRPATWRRLNVLCWVAPNQECLLPVRAQFDPVSDTQNIALSHLQSSEPLPYFLADLVVCKLVSGKTPRLARAVRFTPVGQQPDLRPLTIPGAGTINPYQDDLFKRLVELRQQTKRGPLPKEQRDSATLSLKILVNASAFGINAEFNPETRRAAVNVPAFGLDEFTARTQHPEQPGEYCYPPLAAMITAGGRLLLGMLEAEITRRGGIWAMADTDAMAIVATLTGGLLRCPGGPYRTKAGDEAIRALSFAQVAEIVDGFRRLNPYDERIVNGSILEIEKVNRNEAGHLRSVLCYSLAAKRYTTYLKTAHSRRELTDKYSEHGLGHIHDPRDPNDRATPWATTVWEWVLATHLDPQPPAAPYWADRPAVTQRSISTPKILNLFNEQMEMRPFGFVNHAMIHGRHQKSGHVDLVAPYKADPRKWIGQTWIDAKTGTEHRIETLHCDGLVSAPDRLLVRSYADILDSYQRKAEPKALGPDRLICHAATHGVLQPRHIRNLLITHRGKQGGQLEPLKTDPDLDDTDNELDDRDHRIWQQVVHPGVRRLPIAAVAKATGLHPTAVKDLRTRQRPRPARVHAIIAAVAPLAAKAVAAAGFHPSTDSLTILAQFRDLQ